MIFVTDEQQKENSQPPRLKNTSLMLAKRLECFVLFLFKNYKKTLKTKLLCIKQLSNIKFLTKIPIIEVPPLVSYTPGKVKIDFFGRAQKKKKKNGRATLGRSLKMKDSFHHNI